MQGIAQKIESIDVNRIYDTSWMDRVKNWPRITTDLYKRKPMKYNFNFQLNKHTSQAHFKLRISSNINGFFFSSSIWLHLMAMFIWDGINYHEFAIIDERNVSWLLHCFDTHSFRLTFHFFFRAHHSVIKAFSLFIFFSLIIVQSLSSIHSHVQ